jgi:hypothetical protein
MGFLWRSKKKVKLQTDPDLTHAKRRAEEVSDRAERVVNSLTARKRRNGFTELAATIFRGE